MNIHSLNFIFKITVGTFRICSHLLLFLMETTSSYTSIRQSCLFLWWKTTRESRKGTWTQPIVRMPTCEKFNNITSYCLDFISKHSVGPTINPNYQQSCKQDPQSPHSIVVIFNAMINMNQLVLQSVIFHTFVQFILVVHVQTCSENDTHFKNQSNYSKVQFVFIGC